jgi:hypothetical protein
MSSFLAFQEALQILVESFDAQCLNSQIEASIGSCVHEAVPARFLRPKVRLKHALHPRRHKRGADVRALATPTAVVVPAPDFGLQVQHVRQWYTQKHAHRDERFVHPFRDADEVVRVKDVVDKGGRIVHVAGNVARRTQMG